MRLENYDHLSKSTVSSPSIYPKSPIKTQTNDYKPEDYSHLQRSMHNPSTSRKQFSTTAYNGFRKGSQEVKELRQTFDSRTNSKLQQILQKFNSNNNRTDPIGINKCESKTTYNKTTMQGAQISSPVTYEKKQKKQQLYRKQKVQTNERKVDIDLKYKQYADAVQKLKEHAETTNKMSEELLKLKEDRRKRQEAREKQARERELLQVKQQKQQKETFKKKDSYQYYTPKDDKTPIYTNKFSNEPVQSPKLNLDKYKTSIPAKNQYKKQQYKKEQYKKQVKTQVQSSTSTSSSVSSTKNKPAQKLYNGQIKNFVLGKLLGQGKFGTVYQGFHKPTGSIYAIKKVPKQMIKSHMMVDQFCLEIKLQKFINHENILTLFDFFDDKTSLYLILEYMQQGTLFTYLKKNKRLPEQEVSTKIRQIASAIKYLHEKQIAHRDIKPQNIVMSHGVCKLADFGWATICDQRRKTYCGTFDYAPPEILQGNQYDYTVDLWCLGVLTYELLVGKAPFYHISRKQTMKKILNVEKTVIEYPDFVSKLAISFIQSLIRKDPKQRISSQQILDHPFLKSHQKN